MRTAGGLPPPRHEPFGGPYGYAPGGADLFARAEGAGGDAVLEADVVGDRFETIRARHTVKVAPTRRASALSAPAR